MGLSEWLWEEEDDDDDDDEGEVALGV